MHLNTFPVLSVSGRFDCWLEAQMQSYFMLVNSEGQKVIKGYLFYYRYKDFWSFLETVYLQVTF